MIWITIAAMSVVTFVPRLIPFLLGRNLALPPWVRRWLAFFPALPYGWRIVIAILIASAVGPVISKADA